MAMRSPVHSFDYVTARGHRRQTQTRMRPWQPQITPIATADKRPPTRTTLFLLRLIRRCLGAGPKDVEGVSCCTKSDPFEVKRGRACRQNRERSCFSKNVHLDDVSVAPGFGRALCSPTKFWNGKRRSSSRHCLRQQVKRNSHVVWKHRCCQALRNRFRSSAKC